MSRPECREGNNSYFYTFVDLCHTVGGKIPENCQYSPQKDKPCVFPFKYKGSMYNECTFDGHDIAWCATQVNADKTIVQDQWGHCAAGCPGSLDYPPRSSKTSKPINIFLHRIYIITFLYLSMCIIT